MPVPPNIGRLEFLSFGFGLLSFFIDFVGLPHVEEEEVDEMRFWKLPSHSEFFPLRILRMNGRSIGTVFLAGGGCDEVPRW